MNDEILLQCFGAYHIGNTQNGRIYIGSTECSYQQRFSAHVTLLKSGKHHSLSLQKDWNKFGASSFIFCPACISGGDRWFNCKYIDYIPPTLYECMMSYLFVEYFDIEPLYNRHPAGRRREYSYKTGEIALFKSAEWLTGTTPHTWGGNGIHSSLPLLGPLIPSNRDEIASKIFPDDYIVDDYLEKGYV
jgi:hypothetical protein